MVSIRALQCLVTIVEQGSLTKAAAVLHMSQPALSHQIAALERALGTPVIERRPRGIRPTVAGLAAAAEARVALAAADRAVLAGRRVAAGTGGRIRIASAETMTAWVLVPVLRAGRRRFPGVELDLTEHTSADQMLDSLLAGRADLAVGPRPTLTDERIEVLGHEEVVVLASAEHRFAGLDAVPLAELAGEPRLPPPGPAPGPARAAALRAISALPGIRDFDKRHEFFETQDPSAVLSNVPGSSLSIRNNCPGLISTARGRIIKMGLAWQQGPLAPGAIGRFLVPDPLPERLPYAEPLRRRMRVRFGGVWIADSDDVVLLHEPGRYPVAYFPLGAVTEGVLQPEEHLTRHADFGTTAWYTARAGGHSKPRAAWQHTGLPDYAGELKGRVAFAWRAMDAFYEEDERIVGHAADPYHRIDIRQASRHLLVRDGDRVIASTTGPLALYESGFAPRWYVPAADVDQSALTPAPGQTFCPYKGLCSYWDVAGAHRAAWSYQDAWPEVGRISGLISFEPDKVAVYLDGTRLRGEPGQAVVPHGVDRDLTTDEAGPGRPR